MVGAVSNVVSLAVAFTALGLSLATLAWSIYSFWLSAPRYRLVMRGSPANSF